MLFLNLSRQVEQRDDHKPQLSDLRESGSIEQDADVVMFVYREGILSFREKNQEKQLLSMQNGKQKWMKLLILAQIIIGKQRHGPTR